jgi:hypothetical protein
VSKRTPRRQIRGDVMFVPLYGTDDSIYRIKPLGVVVPKIRAAADRDCARGG